MWVGCSAWQGAGESEEEGESEVGETHVGGVKDGGVGLTLVAGVVCREVQSRNCVCSSGVQGLKACFEMQTTHYRKELDTLLYLTIPSCCTCKPDPKIEF